LLSRFNKALTEKGLPPFVPKGISRIGAFYLPNTLIQEKEIRLLVKRHSGDELIAADRNDAKSDGTFQYWPLSLSEKDICNIDIQGIKVGPNGDENLVRSSIIGTNLSGTSII